MSNLNYKGWGNLSKKLIYGIKALNSDDAGKTILDLMGENLRNFSSIYNDPKYQFKEQVEKMWGESKNSIREQIDELAGSAEIKRGISQAFLIVKELEHVMGKAPSNIYIEFARDEQDKKLTKSRQKTVKEKYDAIKKNYRDLYNDIASRVEIGYLDDENKKADFNKEKFFLYYLQGGKCMYTGEKLDINSLDKYDVDHIIPQSIIKDDSLDNKVLVLKQANMDKLNSDVVPELFRNKMKGYWYELKEAGLITQSKYSRLMRAEFSKNDIGHFINRQLVETRQITKNTAIILSEYFKRKRQEVGIYPVKAGINSLFRKRYDYPKGEGARALNDLHHAKDAYITAFMGDYLRQNYGLDIIERRHTTFYQDYLSMKNTADYNETDDANEKKKYKNKYGLVFYAMNKEGSLWDRKNNDSISVNQALENFDNNYYKIDCYVSRKTEMTNSGKLFKETRHKNKDRAIQFGEINANSSSYNLIPLGKNKFNKYYDTSKYGGYSDIEYAYSLVIKYKKDEKEIIELIGVPRIYTISTSDLDICKFLYNKYGHFEVLFKIPKHQLILLNNSKYLYVSSFSEFYLAKQFLITKNDKELNRFLYLVFKYSSDLNKWAIDNNFKIEGNIKEYINLNFNSFVNVYLTFIKKYMVISERKSDKDNLIQKLTYTLEQANDNYSIEEKIKIIPELLKITANKPVRGKFDGYYYFNIDGEKINLPKEMGRLSFTLNLNKNDVTLIYNSITGIYSRKKKIIN